MKGESVNQKLIEEITDANYAKPKLYPTEKDFERVKSFQGQPYICIAPTSVWFTKQFPGEKWIEFLKSIKSRTEKVYLLGASSDFAICDSIRFAVANENVIINLAGKPFVP